MPNCCIPTQVQFNNANSTSIAYDAVMQSKYGSKPRVFVYYLDTVTHELYLSPFFTVMKYDGTNIVVDHGGSSSGVVVVT